MYCFTQYRVIYFYFRDIRGLSKNSMYVRAEPLIGFKIIELSLFFFLQHWWWFTVANLYLVNTLGEQK